MTENEDWLENVITELKKTEADDQTAQCAKARILSRVRACPKHETAETAGVTKVTRGLLARLMSSRQIMVSPLQSAFAAITLVAVFAGGYLTHQITQFTGKNQLLLTENNQIQFASVSNLQPIQFVIQASGVNEVFLVGDFNNWDPSETALTQTGANGIWSVTVPLPPGRHVFSFVVDGEFRRNDMFAPRAPEDEFGRSNSVILVRKSPC